LRSLAGPRRAAIAIGLGVAALARRERGDSPGWGIAGIVLGGVALCGWLTYFATMIFLASR
jgi:hypothetical protein